MAYYWVKMRCGHEDYVKIVGKNLKEINKTIEWFEKNKVCKECYKRIGNLKREEALKEETC